MKISTVYINQMVLKAEEAFQHDESEKRTWNIQPYFKQI